VNRPIVYKILFTLPVLSLLIMPLGCGVVVDGSYVFDTEVLSDIIANVIQPGNNLTLDEVLNQIESALAASYSGSINTNATWNVNESDGIPGQVKVLYRSSREYLVLVGSPSTMNWSFGPYTSTEIWDFVLFGQLQCYGQEQFEAQTIDAGGQVTLAANTIRNYSIANECWMLEYGRGAFPSTFYGSDVELSGLASATTEITANIANEIIAGLVREWFGLGPSLSF